MFTLQSDCLLYVFRFLDFSHVPTSCLVCSDWNKIASGNSLWEWYFHMMSNNKKGKTNIETSLLEDHNLFWRDMIRYHFSAYYVRTSHKIRGSAYFDLSDQMAFMNNSMIHPFLKQLTKFLCGRIIIERVYYSRNGELMRSFSKSESDLSNSYIIELKIKMRISGLDECIIARTKYSYGNTVSFFRYQYLTGAFVYISTETHDTINEHLQNPHASSNDPVSFSNMNMLQNCFLYVFNGKGNTPTLRGEEYLEDHVLSKCIPTHTQLNLSPRSAIPLLCFIVTCITGDLACYESHHKKEFTHAYPEITYNTFMYFQKYKRYIDRIRNQKLNLMRMILSIPCHCDVEVPWKVCLTINRMIDGKVSVTIPKTLKERYSFWIVLQSKLSLKHKQTFFQDLFTNHHGIIISSTDISEDLIMEEIIAFQKALKRLTNENELLESYLRYKSNKFKNN